MPFSSQITSEDITQTVDRISAGCPIYGAVASNDLATPVSGVFANGEIHHDRLLLVLLAGHLRPLFSTAQAQLALPLNRAVVTHSEGNVVYRVGEYTFLEFMAKNGLVTEASHMLESSLASYASSPVLTYEKGAHRSQWVIRHIVNVDYATGAVTFTGKMPQGFEIAISVLRREDVIATNKACFEEMANKIAQNNTDKYQYSTLFVAACGGRYLIMSGDTSAEGACIASSPILSRLSACGFYAMGEISPRQTGEGPEMKNCAFNSAITLMAV
ncbi:FIST C-terminal domain-containing protein [Oscillospiraceae bacterium MB08-C2-2]|nr:FIST C-terminal domain-containing protein [Oscillospiraceae bacterium MB08-C2-2]